MKWNHIMIDWKEKEEKMKNIIFVNKKKERRSCYLLLYFFHLFTLIVYRPAIHRHRESEKNGGRKEEGRERERARKNKEIKHRNEIMKAGNEKWYNRKFPIKIKKKSLLLQLYGRAIIIIIIISWTLRWEILRAHIIHTQNAKRKTSPRGQKRKKKEKKLLRRWFELYLLWMEQMAVASKWKIFR